MQIKTFSNEQTQSAASTSLEFVGVKLNTFFEQLSQILGTKTYPST